MLIWKINLSKVSRLDSFQPDVCYNLSQSFLEQVLNQTHTHIFLTWKMSWQCFRFVQFELKWKTKPVFPFFFFCCRSNLETDLSESLEVVHSSRTSGARAASPREGNKVKILQDGFQSPVSVPTPVQSLHWGGWRLVNKLLVSCLNIKTHSMSWGSFDVPYFPDF